MISSLLYIPSRIYFAIEINYETTFICYLIFECHAITFYLFILYLLDILNSRMLLNSDICLFLCWYYFLDRRYEI